MNNFIKIFLLCPIPEDQKPINEFITLKNNEFFIWINAITEISKTKIFGIVLFLSLFFTFSNQNILLWNFLFKMFVLFFNFSLFFLVVIAFTWIQVKNRFQKSRLFYEEASWYDGQLWEKPFPILKNDRLIITQQISPFLETIGTKIFSFFIANIVFLLVFLLK